MANAQDVRICGRGIIDGNDYPAWNQAGSYARVPIDLNHSRDVVVEGIMVANSNCWNVNSYSSRNVRIDNVKIISVRQNGDGFTFQSCTDHLVTNCFARTWNDSLVLKNYSGSTRGITFRNIQIWTDLAQSMEIGCETDKGLTLDPEISDVLFEDITVLYNFHKPVISMRGLQPVTLTARPNSSLSSPASSRWAVEPIFSIRGTAYPAERRSMVISVTEVHACHRPAQPA